MILNERTILSGRLTWVAGSGGTIATLTGSPSREPQWGEAWSIQRITLAATSEHAQDQWDHRISLNGQQLTRGITNVGTNSFLYYGDTFTFAPNGPLTYRAGDNLSFFLGAWRNTVTPVQGLLTLDISLVGTTL